MNNIIKACLASLEITFPVSLNYHYMNERNNIMPMPSYMCHNKFISSSLEFCCCLKCRYSFDLYVCLIYAQWANRFNYLLISCKLKYIPGILIEGIWYWDFLPLFVEGIFNSKIRNKYLSGWNCFFQQNSVKVLSFIVHVRKRRALAVVAWLYKQ